MKSWISKKTFATAIVLPVLSGAASANAFECSNATLNGEYAFGDTNYTTLSVVNGIKYFDGNGSLTQRDYQGDSLRTMNLTDFSTGESGEYSVNSDCTGSMTISTPVPGTSTGVLKILFVISGRGQHIHEVVAEFTPPGAANPVRTQSSADDWKVDR
jgi:hypothetical protein